MLYLDGNADFLQGLDTLPEDDRQAITQVWSLFSAAPSKHRNYMLQGILAQCCFPQLSFLSANVRELIRIDFVAALPSEIAFRILCFLDTTSLCKAAQVSRKWRQMADDDVVWHRMCEQHIDRKCTKCGWGLPLLERKRLRANKRQIQLRASGHGTAGADGEDVAASSEPTSHKDETYAEIEKFGDGRYSPVVIKRPSPHSHSSERSKTRPWKDVYKDRFRVGANWRNGRHNLEILKGHSNGVMAVGIVDNILATGSYDDTIKIWDLETCEEIRTLRGHTMGIRCLQIDENKLISGSLDKTMKVWNWKTGECIATYTGHTEGIISLHFDKNVLVSGSIDRTARVWNFRDKSVSTLRGHTDWVNAVRIDTYSRTIFTGSDDCTIKLWDLDSKRCIRTFEGHVGQVQQVVLLPPDFDVEEDDSSPTADQLSDGGSPVSHRSTSLSASLRGRQQSPTFVHRDLPQAATCPFLSSRDSSDPYDMVFSDSDRARPPRYILSSALDSTIRLWETHTGRCVRTFFGHVEGVWALAADSLRIVSGAEDRMVKVWDPRSGKCERTFTGHIGPVTCVGLSDSRLVTAGEDGEVRVYAFGA